MDSKEYIFRTDFMPVFLFVYVVGAIGGAIFILGLVTFDASIHVEKHVMLETIGFYIMVFSPPYAILSAVIMSRYFSYFLTEEGLGGENLIGKSQFIEWDNIQEIKPIHIGNLTYARIHSMGEKYPLWFPLFFKNDQSFDSQLIALTNEDHIARTMVREIQHES
jgi:hypothetical protein